MPAKKTSGKRLTSRQKKTIQGSHHLKARREEIVRTGQGEKSEYSGELTLVGLRGDAARQEALGALRGEVRRIEGRQRKALLVSISKQGGKITVRTSTGQMALALGKHLYRSRKGGRLSVTWSDSDVPVRVEWNAAD
jgi:hypothetical protein